MAGSGAPSESRVDKVCQLIANRVLIRQKRQRVSELSGLST